MPPELNLRFRYNSVFLPEYFTTVLISVPVSTLFLVVPHGGVPGPAWKSAHGPIALGLYALLTVWVLFQSLYYRLVWHSVVLRADKGGELLLHAGARTFQVADIADARESLQGFFGRTARTVELADGRGWPVTVNESLVHYEHFKFALDSLLPEGIRPASETDDARAARIAAAWQERHKLFPRAGSAREVVARLVWRIVCLLPVAVIDVMTSALSHVLLRRLRQLELMVYSAPLSLLISCLIARYVYYYLFTSTVLNRPLET
jgi:hypothetical protein